MSRETQYVNIVEVLRKPVVEREQTEEEYQREILVKAVTLGLLITGCLLVIVWGL
jgi:hypothetical protein